MPPIEILFIHIFPFLLLAVIFVIGFSYLNKKGYSSGQNVIVRCLAGHLFSTVWIPGISLKAIRLGPIRFQYCPVGDHWSWVDIVDRTKLTEAERHFAETHHDYPIP